MLGSDVVLLHAVPDGVLEMQLSPVVCECAVSVFLFHAVAPLSPPLLVEEPAYHSQSTHSNEDNRCDHT